MIKDKKYTGEALKKAVQLKDGEKIQPYYPSDELVEVVAYARLLNRPLLLTGEPGCGKTRLAQAVAYELYGEDYRQHYFEWNIKSTTKAVEGLYNFDYLKKLQDSQTKKINQLSDDKYITLKKLGEAFKASTEETPSILLIDEVDKADIDFPNDLLLELDQRRFEIPEKKRNNVIEAKYPPIVFITSNNEKDLPNAFLRRCLFKYIEFPKPKDLQEIVKAHLVATIFNEKVITANLIEQIVRRFTIEREKMQNNANSDKAPSTSELLDWARLIYYSYANQEVDLNEVALPEKIVFPNALFKTYNDYLLNYGSGL